MEKRGRGLEPCVFELSEEDKGGGLVGSRRGYQKGDLSQFVVFGVGETFGTPRGRRTLASD